jgi:hypothetical protein
MRRRVLASSWVAPLVAGCFSVVLFGSGCGSSSSSPPGGGAGTTGGGGAAGAVGRGGGAGSSSVAGASGTTGSGGAAGTTGSGGSAGTTGSGGSAGASGQAGRAGSGGLAGASGTTGTGGSAGTTGSGGSAGTTGSGGSAGATGSGGSAGTTGSGGSAAGGKAGSGTAGAGGTGGANAACAPGARTCGQGNDVDVCNSSGTSTLFLQTCANGCSGGLCTGGCTAGATRCNRSGTSDVLEQCDSTGTTWQVTQTCASFCDARNAKCATAAQDITTDTTLDGVVVVNGAFVVHAGATLTSPTGNLTIYATSIIVESGASIVVAPTGTTAAGQGPSATVISLCGGRGLGGGYGTPGGVGSGCTGTGGPSFGSSTDSLVSAGSPGGSGVPTSSCTTGAPGRGGGVLRLIATSSISIAGQISANGAQGGSSSCSTWYGSGGGSGGGILLAADQLTVTGNLSTAGGVGGPQTGGEPGGDGGVGRVKLLYGSSHSVTGSVTGTRTDGLLPPLTVTSTTHPDPTLVYNDGFTQATFAWSQSFPSRQGYYYRFDATASTVPSPSNGTFLAAETISLPRSAFAAGSNYFHIVSVDATSTVGAVQTAFQVAVNTTPPTISSSSHPSQTTWVNNPAAFFSWTLPVADASLKGVHYVLDQYANTVPTTADTFLPITQKQLLISNVANGIWVFHVVSRDTRDVLTTQGAHYQVRIGNDPGSGTVSGQVVDGASQPVSGATVTVNRGLFTQTTTSTGNYSFTTVPVGSWEIEVTKTGSASTATKMATVTLGASTTVNLILN